MPYVTQEKRPKLDKVVEALIDAQVVANGDLNYILFKYAKYNVKPSYNNFKNFVGELHECAHEIRRKLLAPYEEIKEVENGSI